MKSGHCEKRRDSRRAGIMKGNIISSHIRPVSAFSSFSLSQLQEGLSFSCLNGHWVDTQCEMKSTSDEHSSCVSSHERKILWLDSHPSLYSCSFPDLKHSGPQSKWDEQSLLHHIFYSSPLCFHSFLSLLFFKYLFYAFSFCWWWITFPAKLNISLESTWKKLCSVMMRQTHHEEEGEDYYIMMMTMKVLHRHWWRGEEMDGCFSSWSASW